MSRLHKNLIRRGPTKNKNVVMLSRYKLVEDLNKIKFKNEAPINLRILKDPFKKTVLSSYSGTAPNLYCHNAIKKSEVVT